MIMLGAFLFALAAWGIISMIKYVSKLSNEEDRGKGIKEGEKQNPQSNEGVQRRDSTLGKQEGSCGDQSQAGSCDCSQRGEEKGDESIP